MKQQHKLPIIPERREKVTGMILNNFLISKGKTDLGIKKCVFGKMRPTPKAKVRIMWADM
jgi:hypothetical protein